MVKIVSFVFLNLVFEKFMDGSIVRGTYQECNGFTPFEVVSKRLPKQQLEVDLRRKVYP